MVLIQRANNNNFNTGWKLIINMERPFLLNATAKDDTTVIFGNKLPFYCLAILSYRLFLMFFRWESMLSLTYDEGKKQKF